MRIPRPPPPATALIMIEEPLPSDWKKLFASSRLVAPEVPGITVMPHRAAIAPSVIAEQLEDFRARSDEVNSFLVAAACECGVLAEKAVAGMNRIAAEFLGDGDDPLGVEICLRARAFERLH